MGFLTLHGELLCDKQGGDRVEQPVNSHTRDMVPCLRHANVLDQPTIYLSNMAMGKGRNNVDHRLLVGYFSK